MFSHIDLARIHTGIIMFSCHFNTVMLRMKCLDNNASGFLTPAGTSGYLGNQLKCPLTSPEIRKPKTGIGKNYADQRNIGEMMPLGYHLSAQKNINFATVYRF